MCASPILGCKTIGSRARGTNEVSLWLGSTPLICISHPHGSRASFLGRQFEARNASRTLIRPPTHAGQPASPNKRSYGQQCSWSLRSCTCACGSISPKEGKVIWNDATACADRYRASKYTWVVAWHMYIISLHEKGLRRTPSHARRPKTSYGKCRAARQILSPRTCHYSMFR